MSAPVLKSPLARWIDYRLPVFSFLNHELNEYPTPRNLSYWWNFGSLAGIMLVVMTITQQIGVNILNLKAGLDSVLSHLAGVLPAGIRITRVYDLAEFVEDSIASVRDAILIGVGQRAFRRVRVDARRLAEPVLGRAARPRARRLRIAAALGHDADRSVGRHREVLRPALEALAHHLRLHHVGVGVDEFQRGTIVRHGMMPRTKTSTTR